MNGTVKNQLLTKVIDEENHKTYYERNFETTKCNEKVVKLMYQNFISLQENYIYRQLLIYTIVRSYPIAYQEVLILNKRGYA